MAHQMLHWQAAVVVEVVMLCALAGGGFGRFSLADCSPLSWLGQALERATGWECGREAGRRQSVSGRAQDLRGSPACPACKPPTAETYKETRTLRDGHSHEALPCVGSPALLLSPVTPGFEVISVALSSSPLGNSDPACSSLTFIHIPLGNPSICLPSLTSFLLSFTP
ncbi:unnamed protein product [Pleuronectes platessa]|uniref:Uncharacterized protein n=1 Tax=Pleuronectes platessa TaxID=8262 RepID=A0A9N7TUY4_PLEPL|nr:unnamed protein product [Pleuronectes platessa]